jgi:hypothetical protein
MSRIAVITVDSFMAGILGPLAVPREAAEKDSRILLTLPVDVTGQTMVKVQPRDAKLWRNDPQKPQQVRWWTVNSTQYNQVYWEIRHDTTRGLDGAD